MARRALLFSVRNLLNHNDLRRHVQFTAAVEVVAVQKLLRPSPDYNYLAPLGDHLKEVRSYGKGELPAGPPPLRMLDLPTTPSECPGSGTPPDQPPRGRHRRTHPTAPRRLSGAPTRSRRQYPAGTDHGTGPPYHQPRPARTATARSATVRPRSAFGRRTPSRGKKSPEVLTTLEELLRDATAGDPISGLKWTHRSLRKIQKALRRRGHDLAPSTIARLLRQRKSSLRTNRKRLAGIRDPDRDEQFRYLTRLRHWYITHGLPVISVDTKEKEWVGNFKNPGRCWRRRDRDVLDHDYPSWALGRAIPSGVYDLAYNDGYVVIGTTHD